MPHLNLLNHTPLKIAPQKDYQSTLLTYQNHRLSIKEGNTYLIVPISQIIFISADSNYSTLYLSNGKKIMTSKTLKIWEDKIDHPFFIRCHRSYLINMRYIDNINMKSSLAVVTSHTIPMSRSMKSKLLLAIKSTI